MGCAVHSTLPAGKGYTRMLEFKVNFVRAVTHAVALVRAEGKVVHAEQVAVAEGRLVSPDGKLLAHATTTCLNSHSKAPRERVR